MRRNPTLSRAVHFGHRQELQRTTRAPVFTLLLALLMAYGALVSCAHEPAPPRSPYETTVEAFSVIGPTGNRIYCQMRRPAPALYAELAFPAIILIQGGINAGRMEVYGQEARALAGEGMVVVSFNAEGRIDTLAADDLRSEGDEDYNGFRHQDGLACIVEYVAALDGVLADNIGLKSQSYGITMAAGCAARHPELPIRYLVDCEGPSESFVTCHGPRYLAGDLQKYEIVRSTFGRLALWQDASQGNRDWWAEREAVRFIGAFRGAYLRLQATWDHAQPPESDAEIAAFHHPTGWPGGGPAWWHNKHATDMVNAAVAGGVPWVRVNLQPQGNAPNATYDAETAPTYLPGHLADESWSVRAVLEMAGI
ncbi:MAG: hypothetical protein AB1778_07545 [Candidatus Bipolaricaulota bacterium]